MSMDHDDLAARGPLKHHCEVVGQLSKNGGFGPSQVAITQCPSFAPSMPMSFISTVLTL